MRWMEGDDVAGSAPESGPELRVATANVQYTLGVGLARESLAAVLASEPDLIALQEWYPSRWPLLRESGRVGPVPSPPWLTLASRTSHESYTWTAHIVGGCVVGGRRDRFTLVSRRSILLTWPGRAERPDRWLGLEPPRYATVAVFRDLSTRQSVALLSYHLVSGVQQRGVYRADRPNLSARHEHEVQRLTGVIDRLRSAGHQVFAAGDGNFHGLRFPTLASAWDGRETHPGTLGPHRRVDDIHGPARPTAVRLVDTPSDHAAVIATFSATG